MAAPVAAADAVEMDLPIARGVRSVAVEVEARTASAAVVHSDVVVSHIVVQPEHRTAVARVVAVARMDHRLPSSGEVQILAHALVGSGAVEP